MKPVVERLEFGKNNFSKWIHLVFLVLCIAAFFLSLDRTDNTVWYAVAGILLFGGIYLTTVKYRIVTDQDGFIISELFRQRTIGWKDVTALKYEIVYHGKGGAELKLKILYGSPGKKHEISVKQFNKQKMQRFFEMLNEQCENASKNEHFVKQATGEMKSWKEQLKMY